MDFLNKLGDTITTKGKEVAGKAKETAEIVSLKSQISSCEDGLKKTYAEIGKQYFEQYGDMPEEGFAGIAQAVKDAQKKIADMQERVKELMGL